MQDPDVVPGLSLSDPQFQGVVVSAGLEPGAPRRAVVARHGDDPYARVNAQPRDVPAALAGLVDDHVDAHLAEAPRKLVEEAQHDALQGHQGVLPGNRGHEDDEQVTDQRRLRYWGTHAPTGGRAQHADQSQRGREHREGPQNGGVPVERPETVMLPPPSPSEPPVEHEDDEEADQSSRSVSASGQGPCARYAGTTSAGHVNNRVDGHNVPPRTDQANSERHSGTPTPSRHPYVSITPLLCGTDCGDRHLIAGRSSKS